MLETYGPSGLVALAVLASLTFFVFMQVVIYVKRMVVDELRFKGMHSVLAIPIYWFFLLEGVYVSTVILNFLVPFSPSLTQALSFRAIIVGMYFTGISVLNKTQMKQFPRV